MNRHRDLFLDLSLILPKRLGAARGELITMPVRQIMRLVGRLAKDG